MTGPTSERLWPELCKNLQAFSFRGGLGPDGWDLRLSITPSLMSTMTVAQPELTVEAHVPDVVTREKVRISLAFPVYSPSCSAAELSALVKGAVLTLMRHEFAESLLRDGEPLSDPHEESV